VLLTKFAITCLMIWGSLTSQASQNEDESGLPDYVIDSGFQSKLDSLGIMSSTYWLDNERVLAMGRGRHATTQSNGRPIVDQGLYIWKIGEKPARYGDYNLEKPYCYADGRIFAKLQRKNEALVGPLHNPGTGSLASSKYEKLSPLRAALVMCPDYIKTNFKALRERDGLIESNTTLKPQNLKWWSEDGHDAVEIPVNSMMVQEIKYIAFKDKYFLTSISPGESVPIINYDPAKQWKETGCWPAWWFSPGKQIEEVCIRNGPWSQVGHLAVWPTTKGYFVARSHSGGSGAAAYLLADEGYKLLIKGWIEGPSVSPDGTKISFGLSKKAPRMPMAGESAEDFRQTLMVIDLNKVDLEKLIPYEKGGIERPLSQP
jgi:hypothetical protein